jgi:hypothetical protein
MEQAFWSLDGPWAGSAPRKCRSPIPSISKTPRSRRSPGIVAAARAADGALRWASSHALPRRRHGGGKLVEWLVKPGDTVIAGDVVAVVETQKGAIEIEIFEDGSPVSPAPGRAGQLSLPMSSALRRSRRQRPQPAWQRQPNRREALISRPCAKASPRR